MDDSNSRNKFEGNPLVEKLADKVLALNVKPDEFDRHCWAIVHAHLHGFVPVEYDIRDIDEDLFLAVLKTVRLKSIDIN